MISILLVEDDDYDAEAIQRSFNKLGISSPIFRAHDGVEAMQILRGQDNIKKIERPYLILLDINMPRMNGFEFLEELRSDTQLKDTVVFMLSTSDDERDKKRAYSSLVAGYMNKAKVGPGFKKVAEMLNSYTTAVSLPR